MSSPVPNDIPDEEAMDVDQERDEMEDVAAGLVSQRSQPEPPKSSSPFAGLSSSPAAGDKNGGDRMAGSLGGQSSPLNYPSSSPAPAAGGTGGQDRMRGPGMAGRSSSPLAFPTSSPAAKGGGRGRVDRLRVPGLNGNSSSPLPYPSSSPAPNRNGATNARNGRSALFNPPSSSARSARSSQAGGRAGGGGGGLTSEPLFFPGSNNSTPRASARSASNRRGDIHSSAPANSSPLRDRNFSTRRRQNQNQNDPTSDAASVMGRTPAFSAQAPPSSDAAGGEGGAGGAGGEPKKVIWGTMVGVQETMDCFKKFLMEFKVKYRWNLDGKEPPVGADGERTIYVDYLRTMRITSQTNLNLDMRNLESYPPTKKMFGLLINYPHEVVPIMDQVLKDAILDLAEEDRDARFMDVSDADIDDIEGRIYKVRPFGGVGDGIGGATNMRDLNPGDIDKLVSIKGLVIRATPIIPDMKLAFFRCLVCGHTKTVENDRGRIEEPERCPREVCNIQGSMSLIHNRSEFADRQVVRLQETPDAVPDGQTPHTVSLCVYDELVDLSKPGDRVTVTGIFRSVPVRVNPRQRTIKSLFKTYIDIVHVKKTDAKRLGLDMSTREGEAKLKNGAVGVGGDDDEGTSANDDEDEDFEDGPTDEEGRTGKAKQTMAELEGKLVELSQREDIYDLLSRSLAPSIWEMDDIKKGILLQMFGGTNKSIGRGGGGGGPRYRGDINVLLVGDPGTSKSQILQYVHKIAPRGVYTSGKGSSAVGLTAYVTRDPDSKQLVLESGALVLSDGGVCCIDEFDKMSDSTRSVLHEVMEQQTVSIAKAGIITTLNARTSILAAANPVGSKYNLKWPITRNIDLPPTLISRFDLLYLVLDRIDEVNDRRLARHLVGLYLEDRPETGGQDVLPLETLTSYISFARGQINPVLTQEASDALVSKYVAMRKTGEDPRTNERRITATTRQLESMIRLSEAHARMRFSARVEEEDVIEADRLIREALKESATDPTTGLLDLDLLSSGTGLQQRKLRADLSREILGILDRKDPSNKGMRYTELVKQLGEQSSIPIESGEIAEVLKAMEGEGEVKVMGERDRKLVRKLAF